jgi:hypothetical protein
MRRFGALLGAISCAIACRDAAGSFVYVRDALGGESPLGSPGGYYLEGTGALSHASLNGEAVHIGTGVFDFELSFGDDIWTPLLTFCTEPDVDVGFDEAPANPDGFLYGAVPLSSGSFTASEAVIVEKLWANAFNTALLGRIEAGAFQAIIWELAEDDSIDLSSGNYSINELFGQDAAVADLARSWLENIDNNTWTSRESLRELINPFSQNLLIPMGHLPSPGSITLLSLGSVLAVRRRRGSRRP